MLNTDSITEVFIIIILYRNRNKVYLKLTHENISNEPISNFIR